VGGFVFQVARLVRVFDLLRFCFGFAICVF